MADRILVPFAGPGCGIDELTWGQRGIWGAIRAGGGPHNIGGVFALPPGSTVDGIAAWLRYLVGRHQALRTRYRLDPDGGLPQQVLSSAGELPMDIIDAIDAAEDPAATADAAWERSRATEFDYEHEWPVRATLVRRHDALTHMVVTYCHLAVDAHGIGVLVADLANVDAETPPPVTATQPLALARQQRSRAARRAHDASLRHWSGLVRTVAAQRLGNSADRRVPRYWELVCDSPAAYRAALIIAARERVDTTPVLLAAYAVAIGRLTGDHVFVTQSLVSNRFRPGLADAVATLAQPGLCVVNVAGITFAEAVARARQSIMSGSLNAYYEPFAHRATLAEVNAERGEVVDLGVFFNDNRIRDRNPSGMVDVDPRPLLPLTELRWARKLDSFGHRLFLHVNDAPDTLAMTLLADTHRLSPSDIMACARGMEAVLVAAALDPNTVTGIGTSCLA
ncbi:MAG TPA: condensation domain-containing protein [Pseudonocardiaceae bacterium]